MLRSFPRPARPNSAGRDTRGPRPSWTLVLLRQALAEHLLALLSTLAALALGATEEVSEVGVAFALGVVDVALQSQRVAQALLGEPDDVVVPVLGAGDLAGLLSRGHWLSFRPELTGSRLSTPVAEDYTRRWPG